MAETEPRIPKPKFSRSVEIINKALDELDLPKLREKFPTVDVNRAYEEFCETCLNGTAQDPRPNPYKYVNFSLAFQNWLRRRERFAPKGQRFQPSKPQRSWRDF